MSYDIEKIIKDNVEKLKDKVSQYLNETELYALTKAIIKRESNFKVDCVVEEKNVNDYSIGLMQVRIDTAMGVLNLYSKTRDEMYKMLLEPNLNVYVGMKYLIYQVNRYKGNLKLAIASYNSGTAKIKSTGEYIKTDNEIYNYVNEPLINEDYVNYVLKYYNIYLSEKKNL